MRTLMLVAGGYPGPYVEPESNPGLTGDALSSLAPGVALVMLLMIAFFAFISLYLMEEAGADPEWSVVPIVVILGCVVGMFFSTSAMRNQVSADEAEAADHRVLYDQTLVNWLAEDYGVATDAPTVNRLLAGETFATEYGGRQVSVSLIDTLDGSKVLVDENRAPLAVIGGE